MSSRVLLWNELISVMSNLKLDSEEGSVLMPLPFHGGSQDEGIYQKKTDNKPWPCAVVKNPAIQKRVTPKRAPLLIRQTANVHFKCIDISFCDNFVLRGCRHVFFKFDKIQK